MLPHENKKYKFILVSYVLAITIKNCLQFYTLRYVTQLLYVTLVTDKRHINDVIKINNRDDIFPKTSQN